MSIKQLKIGGKRVKPKSKQNIKIDNSAQRESLPAQRELTEDELEIQAKLQELHDFLAAKNATYIIVVQASDTQLPQARYSFNHKHNNIKQTVENAEMLFTYLGQFLSNITHGIVKLIKFY